MTEEQYQVRKAGIQVRLQKAMLETERRLLEIVERAASELYDLEREYKGIMPPPIYTATSTASDCLSCGASIPFGEPYCAACSEKIDALQSSKPLMAVNLAEKGALQRFLADPANRDNPLLDPSLTPPTEEEITKNANRRKRGHRADG